MRNLRKILLFFYFIVSLFFMETILRVSTIGILFASSLIFSLLFSIPFAFVFYIICILFKGKVTRILPPVLLGLTSVIFCSQLIYYKIFKTFYSLYSAGNSDQILQFWMEIINIIIKNIIWVILIFLPVVLILIFRRIFVSFKKPKIFGILYLFIFTALSHTAGLLIVNASGCEQCSPFDLYNNSSYSNISVEKLGLLTTMRLDLQRLVFGWTPAAPALSTSYVDLSAVEAFTTRTFADETIVNETIEEKPVQYNTLNIDFDSLISGEKQKAMQDMHRYFQSVQPAAKNNYTGIYKGYNLILITAEGFSPYAVRKDATPTLYKMVNDGYCFKNFYNPIWGVSTSDGEYAACTSLIPKPGVWSFKESGSIYMPLVMGNQLKSLGYKTMAYHNHTYTYYRRDISHPNMGYIYKGLGNGLDVKNTWPESDLEMMEKTIPEYINEQPFHAYYMTVSGHLEYSFMGNSMSQKNKEYVRDLPYSEQAKAYIACQIELDKAMEYLLKQLENAGIANKTLIALSADHYPFGLDDQTIDELAGHHVERNFELYRSPFILYTEGMTPAAVDKPCSSLDIIPTISNMMGLEFDSRLLMGRDIFSDSPPLVMFVNKSYITDKGSYNTMTKEFIPSEGSEVDDNYIKEISDIVNAKFYYSAKILETDYYRKVLIPR